MVQEVSGARVPPPKVIVGVLTPETVPPQLFASRLLKVRPATAVVRSSVNAMPVAEKSRSRLLTMKSSVTGTPGGTGSSVKDLLRAISVTSRVALALPLLPAGLSASSPVTLSSIPAPVAATSTVMVHVAPATTIPKPRLIVLVPDPLTLRMLERTLTSHR